MQALKTFSLALLFPVIASASFAADVAAEGDKPTLTYYYFDG